MKPDNILEVGINQSGQLYVKPERESFILVYRTTSQVHWNKDSGYLFSPVPVEWTYFDWYKYIITVINNECYCKLSICASTIWVNIPNDLREVIVAFHLSF